MHSEITQLLQRCTDQAALIESKDSQMVELLARVAEREREESDFGGFSHYVELKRDVAELSAISREYVAKAREPPLAAARVLRVPHVTPHTPAPDVRNSHA